MRLQSGGQFVRFPLGKPRVELALFDTPLMCMCHLRSNENWVRVAGYELENFIV